MSSRGWSIAELLVVTAILALLGALAWPALQAARGKARQAACQANLHAIGQMIHTYAQAHEDHVAPAVRERDYYWDHGPQRGWDLQTGRWADSLGGPGSVWRCPAGRTAYMANTHATGLDTSQVNPAWPVYLVRTAQWFEPARLVIAYDVQTNMVEFKYGFPQAAEPYIADISDEKITPWPHNSREVTVPFWMNRFGPHEGERYGVLFGDGHVELDLFIHYRAVLWSGPRWWP